MKRNFKRTIALLLCLFTMFAVVQTSVFALPTTTLTKAVTKPSQVKNVKATAGTNYVTLTWSKASNAQKYYVFSYNASTKKYTCLGNTTNLTYKISNLKANTTYRFAVQAARVVSGKTYYGTVSAYVTVTTKSTGSSSAVAKVSGLKISASGKNNYLKLSWNTQKNVTGFQIFRSTSGKSGSYSRIASVRNGQVSYADTGLKSSTTYYYAVRAFRTTSKGNVYGSFSKIDLSTRLTESGLKRIIKGANKCYFDWVWGEAVKDCLDHSDYIVKGDYIYYYRVKSKTIKTIKDVKAKLRPYFSESFCNSLMRGECPSYIERNGKLYYLELVDDIGSLDYLRLDSVSCYNKKCIFSVTTIFPAYGYSESPSIYTLYYNDGRWVFNDRPVVSATLFYGDDPWLN
ncbi:MAG: fibronectin type III domain-containing protein [Acutalibacteraceae bacterium]